MTEQYDVDQTVHTESPFSRIRVHAWSGEGKDFRGSATVEVIGEGVAYLKHIEVEEAHRGQGVAKRMVGHVLSTYGIRELRAHLATREADGLFASLRRERPDVTYVEL